MIPPNAHTFPPLAYLAFVLFALVGAAIFTYCTTRDSAMTAHAMTSTRRDWLTRLCRWCVGYRKENNDGNEKIHG